MIHIVDNQYLGSVYYYKSLFTATHIKIEKCERHVRSGFSNMCYIAGANGLIKLSIPVLEGRNQKTVVSRVEIDNSQRWQLKHWRAIESSYMRSPWYEYYRDQFRIFYDSEYKYLFEWNLVMFRYIMSTLEWRGEVSLT